MEERCDYPRMMYAQWPEYKIAFFKAEADELLVKGYFFETWTAQGQKKEVKPPQKAEEPKNTKCAVCGRNLKRFSHERCQDAIKEEV